MSTISIVIYWEFYEQITAILKALLLLRSDKCVISENCLESVGEMNLAFYLEGRHLT
jgi:hypothetical protein